MNHVNEKLNDKLIYCSFWMTIIIVIYHASPHLIEMSESLRGGYVGNFFEILGPVALSYFFAISAYKFYVSQRGYVDKLQKRVITLLLPYAVWNTLYIPLQMLQNGLPRLKTIVMGYTFTPFDGPLWYIFVLYLFFILSYQLDKRTLSRKLIYITLLICVISAMFHYMIITDIFSFALDYWLERTIRMVPPFLFGAYCGKNSEKINWNYSRKIHVIGIVGAAITIIGATLLGDGFITTLLIYICTYCLWLAIPYFKITEKSLLKQGVFFIYAIHEGVIIVLLALINKAGISNYSANIWSLMLILGVLVFLVWSLSLTISRIVKHCPSVIDIMLTGGRNH